jgi:hypothetical protein
MSGPDLTLARKLFHYRDPALDHQWGEGSEITLYALPDGRYYLEDFSYHVDWDDRRDDRFLSREEGIQAIARHGGGAQVPLLFPDSQEARWQERFGTCYWHDLDDHEDQIEREAEIVWSTPPAGDDPRPATTVWSHPDGLWLVDEVHEVSREHLKSLVRPEEALAALLRAGCPTATLEARLPDAAAVRLLGDLGAESWPQAEQQFLPGLAAASELIVRLEDEGSVSMVRLGRPEGLFLFARARDGATTFEVLDALGATRTLLPLQPPDEVWQRAFPRPGEVEANVRDIQRRAGIRFPGAEDERA